MTTNSANSPVEGRLDGLADGRVRGWAWYPADPARVAMVELLSGDRVVASTTASAKRADLETAGKRNGECAFEFLGVERFPAGVLRVRVSDAGGAYDLEGEAILVSAVAAPEVHAPPPPPSAPATFASRLAGPRLEGYLDVIGPDIIRGWAWRPGDASHTVTLQLFADDHLIATFDAKKWRPDLAEHRQGDGRCGVLESMPSRLRDDAPHLIDIRDAETGCSVIAHPVVLLMERPAPEAAPQPVRRPPDGTAPLFSIIVNFYNMQREAERTLTSLARTYQRGVENIAYEVLVIDNGSKPPMAQDWVESFGPEFRVFKPSQILPSPVNAINEAARASKGRYVAIMIDGAHVLTPGVLRAAADGFEEMPDGIFAVRQWWVAGDQRWLSSASYTREKEDILFARIDWPNDGYELFRVGAPIVESPNSWFDGMGESNCLFVPRDLYDRIGGMDEGFSEPGAGFANLDLFRRAAAEVVDRVICPLGEASFHQYHNGTTTNVSNEEKDRRVRGYENRYRDLRGEEFGAVNPDRIFLRGRIGINTMPMARQRPWFTAELGVTEHVRPGNMPQHFDSGAQLVLQGAYVECGLHEGTTWAGRRIRLAPADLINIQAALNTVRPNVIVTTSRDDGFIHFLDTVLKPIALEGVAIVRVLREPRDAPAPDRVRTIIGDPYAPETLARIRREIGADEEVVVLFEPQQDDFLPIEQLRTYAQFVSFRSYLVFLGTTLGQPWLGYSRYWFATAIRALIAKSNEFVVDPLPDQQIACMCAGGFLQRVRQPLFEPYDASLDYFEDAET